MDVAEANGASGKPLDWSKVTTVGSDVAVAPRRSAHPPQPPRHIPSGAVHDPSTVGKGRHRGCLYGIDANKLARRIHNSPNRLPIKAADMEVLIENTGALCMVCLDCHATVIEHCHTTGRIRGITCQQCNDRCTVIDNGQAESARAIGTYGYPCWCVDLSRQDGADDAQRLLAAAHAFIGHAMSIEAPDVTSAFSELAEKPYPL